MGNPGSRTISEAGISPVTKIGNVRWTICAMLFAATTINYMDRMVMGLLKPILMHSAAQGGIGMTEVGYANVMSCFTLFYAIGLLFVGRFVDKVGTRIGYMVIMAAWSLSAMSHALANSVFQFGIARTCLGLGESGNFPAANKANAEWFPQKERSFSFGIFNCGANVGVVLASIIVPLVVIHFNWHYAFLVTGVLSASWILLWFFKYRKPTEHPTLSAAELAYINQEPPEKSGPSTPWINLLDLPQTWAYSIPKFLTDPIWWFYLYWLPGYFSDKFHLDLMHLGLPIFIVYSASTVGSVYGGYLPASFIRMGLTAARARLGAMLLCASMVVPVFLINYTSSEWVAIGLLSLAAAAHQGWSCNLFTTCSDMFPRSEVGSITSIGAAAGSIGGFLFIQLAGHVLQISHSYSLLFIIAASIYILSLLILVLFAPGLKKVQLAPVVVDLWSFKGRIGRGSYWARLTLLNLVGLFACFLIVTLFGLSTYLQPFVQSLVAIALALIMIPICIGSIWLGLTTQIKRWHDLGHSGWMVLLNFTIIAIPFTFIYLGFFRGEAGLNKFGANPIVGGSDGGL
jgi:ACS family hexuronate transporter-like MFS transporter